MDKEVKVRQPGRLPPLKHSHFNSGVAIGGTTFFSFPNTFAANRLRRISRGIVRCLCRRCQINIAVIAITGITLLKIWRFKPMAKSVDLKGLDKFNFSGLLKAAGDPAPVAGGVAQAPIEKFHEDPENARKEFDSEKLQELADSMHQVNPSSGKPRGILEPLLVTDYPEKPGEYLICGGHRRFRAAKIAGLKELPYILNDNLDSFDKFILNEQRENLSTIEIATFITERLKEGHKAGEIAKKLSKSPSFVSYHSVFFDLADCIRSLYDNGICRSIQAIFQLHQAYKKKPGAVEDFCRSTDQELTAAKVRLFVSELKEPRKAPAPKESEDQKPATPPADTKTSSGQPSPEETQRAFPRAKGSTVEIHVKHEDRAAVVMTEKRSNYGLAWIRYEDGEEAEVSLSTVQVVAILTA